MIYMNRPDNLHTKSLTKRKNIFKLGEYIITTAILRKRDSDSYFDGKDLVKLGTIL